MKNQLIALAILGFATAAHAQVNSFGPTLGFNYAWVSDNANSDPKPGLNVGVIYNYSILEKSGIGFEALYSQEGFTNDVRGRTLKTALNYIRVPLKFTYYFGQLENDFRPKVFLGPSLGFLIGGDYETLVGENIITKKSKDIYQGFDFGIQAGAGFNYRLAKMTWLNFGVGYTHGLVNVIKNVQTKPQNRLINANLGIAFGF